MMPNSSIVLSLRIVTAVIVLFSLFPYGVIGATSNAKKMVCGAAFSGDGMHRSLVIRVALFSHQLLLKVKGIPNTAATSTSSSGTNVIPIILQLQVDTAAAIIEPFEVSRQASVTIHSNITATPVGEGTGKEKDNLSNWEIFFQNSTQGRRLMKPLELTEEVGAQSGLVSVDGYVDLEAPDFVVASKQQKLSNAPSDYLVKVSVPLVIKARDIQQQEKPLGIGDEQELLLLEVRMPIHLRYSMPAHTGHKPIDPVTPKVTFQQQVGNPMYFIHSISLGAGTSDESSLPVVQLGVCREREVFLLPNSTKAKVTSTTDMNALYLLANPPLSTTDFNALLPKNKKKKSAASPSLSRDEDEEEESTDADTERVPLAELATSKAIESGAIVVPSGYIPVGLFYHLDTVYQGTVVALAAGCLVVAFGLFC